MVTRRRMPTILAHLVLMTGVCIIVFPVWMALVASTHPPEALSINPIPMWFGDMGPENYTQLLSGGIPEAGGVSVDRHASSCGREGSRGAPGAGQASLISNPAARHFGSGDSFLFSSSTGANRDGRGASRGVPRIFCATLSDLRGFERRGRPAKVLR